MQFLCLYHLYIKLTPYECSQYHRETMNHRYNTILDVQFMSIHACCCEISIVSKT